MFRREFFILCALATAIFLMVAAAGFWIGHTISTDAGKIAVDTVPSLVDAGSAMTLAQDNWLRVQLLASTTSATEQSALIGQIGANSNEGLWRDYGQSIYDPEERQQYHTLLSDRGNYLQLREEYFALIRNGQNAAARDFLRDKLAPAYERYRDVSNRLFQYNATDGLIRAARIIWISRLAPPVLGACAIVIFAFGLIAGMRGVLTGLNLASRFPKK